MEAHKSGKGRVVSQNNYRQSLQIRKRTCYGCGKLGHFVRDCPTKRRKNGAHFNPQNQQKYYLNHPPLMGTCTYGSMGPTFKQQNKSCNEIASKISASNLREGFSSRPSDFSEDYSSSASDFSKDYSSSAIDSLEYYSFAAYGNQFEDYLSSASESSSTLHSSEVYSSSVSDSPQYSYSVSASHSSVSTSDSSIIYFPSYTDKYEGQDLNESEDSEEIQPLQSATSSIAQKASDECLHFPIGTGVDSLSQIIGQVSKQSLDSAECHKVVQTMHNLSVLLLINSSFSDNLSESDLPTLQSIICNLSQCLKKSTSVSKSTDVTAFMPDKQLVAANSVETEKDCHAAEEKEDPVGKRCFQMSAEVYQSQMVNIEVELNSIKSEIRCLRTELEMEGLKKTHAGTHANGDIESFETLANRNDVNNGSCPGVNLVIKENEFDYTSAPVSQEKRYWLPDLNLDPVIDYGSFIGESYIKKNKDDVISQNNISEEPIHKSSLNSTAHNPGQPNAEAETKQIEGQFRVLQEPGSCSESGIEYMRDFAGNTLLEDGATTESANKIGSSIYVHGLENVDVMHALEENTCFESDSSWEQILMDDGAMTESPTKIGSLIDIHNLENVDVGLNLGENPCLESDSTWEQINFSEEDHI